MKKKKTKLTTKKKKLLKKLERRLGGHSNIELHVIIPER